MAQLEATAEAGPRETVDAARRAGAQLGWHHNEADSHAGLLVFDKGSDAMEHHDRLELQVVPIGAEETRVVVETAMTWPVTDEARGLRAAHELLDATLAAAAGR